MQPEFRVFLLKQPVANPLPPPVAAQALAAGLAAIFVPKLVELAIGGLATLLKKAGADETSTVSGAEVTSLYRANAAMALGPNEDVGAILGVWGVFSDENGRPTPADDQALLNLEQAGFVPRNADINIIFEALIRRTSDNTALYLETRHFSVRSFIGNRGGDRSFVATLAIKTPNATADGDTIGVGNIHLGRLRRGDSLIPDGHPEGAYPRLRSNLLPWKTITQSSKAAYDADVAAKQAANKLYMPVELHLSLSETADGNKFLAALGELLEGAKKEAAAEISKRILPEDPEKAREEEAKRAEAMEKLYVDELDALLALRLAVKAYNEADAANKPLKQVEKVKAQRKYDRAVMLRKAAGLPDRADVPEN